jgi:hypothetical protein
MTHEKFELEGLRNRNPNRIDEFPASYYNMPLSRSSKSPGARPLPSLVDRSLKPLVQPKVSTTSTWTRTLLIFRVHQPQSISSSPSAQIHQHKYQQVNSFNPNGPWTDPKVFMDVRNMMSPLQGAHLHIHHGRLHMEMELTYRKSPVPPPRCFSSSSSA